MSTYIDISLCALYFDKRDSRIYDENCGLGSHKLIAFIIATLFVVSDTRTIT